MQVKMNRALLLVSCFLLNDCWADDPVINNKKFPLDFLFGTATSAYQIEGAWNLDGKGENIWDRAIHTNRSFTKNGDSGDVACDSYHLYKEDVQNLQYLGVNHYRFSISWSRLLPDGLAHRVNQAGVEYYRNLIAELRKNHIEPFVTLFHWDLPQTLQDLGGFPNPEFVRWYSEYARLCFQLFGADVKYWMTFNEPKQTCTRGYGVGDYAPAIQSPGEAEYLCVKNLLLAHATAWNIYQKDFKAKYEGEVGIVIDSNWWEPENSTDVEDQQASETMLQFTFGLYANPLHAGDFPDLVKNKVLSRSLAQGFQASRLPAFTDAERRLLKGSYDFFGVNMYSSALVTPERDPDPESMGYKPDSEVRSWFDPSWEKGASSWLVVTPWGARKLLKWIAGAYGNPKVYVTENGYSDFNGTLEDDGTRVKYIQQYLSSIKDAMDEDKVNVKGYTVWSLMDNLEWLFGYTNKFGLFQVDFDDPKRTRKPKNSAKFYKKLIETRCLVEKCE
uniref:Glycoside hydrolase family 1 n=1 Tax=Phyllotreta striolata TaxID=444603 RepID=A0A059UDL1_PHYSR|nr:glycoside hydrolase family 1 [Phyllotreta striolata]